MASEKRSPQVAASPAGPAAKRARKAQEAKEAKELGPRIENVASAVEDPDLPCDVPAHARAMLAAGAAAALRTSTEERHPLQNHVVELLTDFYQKRSILEALQSRVAEAKSAVDTKENELAVMNNALEVAGSELAEATSALNAEEAKLEEFEAAVTASLEGQKSTRVAKKGVEKAKAAVEKDKAKYTSLDGTLKTLIDGTLETEKEAQKTANKLIKDLQKHGAEDALTGSLPASLVKRPSERQGFDTVIIEAAKDFVGSFIKKDDEKLQEHEAEGAALDAKMKEHLEVSEKALAARQEQQSQQCDPAQAKQTAKAEAVTAAEAALTAGRADLAACRDTVSSCEEKAHKFEETLADFKLLAAWSPTPPPAEPVAEQEPAETAGAA